MNFAKVVFLCCGFAVVPACGSMKGQQVATQRGHAQVTGVYSNLFIHPETLDALGREIVVSKIDRENYSVVFQCAEGQMNAPLLAHAVLSKGWLEFALSGHLCGNKFRAQPTARGLWLEQDGSSAVLIPRHHSFWENHE